jgi:hypothetical protein
MANTVQIVVNLRDNASSALDGITSGLKGMATVAGGIIAADVIGRIGSGLASVAADGFNFNRAVENATARLNAFTKDSAVSAGILEDLRIEASKTPFAFEEMANAGAALLPVANSLDMQLMDLVSTAEILAASNPAEGLEGAAFALKEAASGDFASAIERFNLSRSTINALKEEGVPNMEIIALAMAEMGLDMDLVGNLATTFDGRMSTLKDTITTAAGAFSQPIFDFLSEQIFGLQGTLDENMPAIEERLRGAGQFIADTFQTITEAWNGEWVDSEMIQPMHRLAGTLTQDVKAGLETVQGLWDRAQEFWASGWLQNNVINPLVNFARLVGTTFVENWNKLTTEWHELNEVGDAWNDLMAAGEQLWSVLVGFAKTLGINVGDAAGKQAQLNNTFEDATPIIDLFVGGIQNITKFVSQMAGRILQAQAAIQGLINWLNSAISTWNTLSAAVAAGTPTAYPEGVPVGGTDVGGTGSTTTGGTTVGGGVGVDAPGNRGAMGGGVVIYATVRNDQDINALAYEISKVQKANR